MDVAWGGMFYVIADAAPFGLRLTPDEGRDITRIGELIKAATREQLPVVHPENPEIQGRDDRAALGTGGFGPAITAATPSSSRPGTLDWNRPSTWTGAIDRSPCGTGTCAKMATLHARGPLKTGRAVPARRHARHGVHRHCCSRRRSIGPYPAVVPQLSGTAWITGFAQYVVDPEDPFPDGFTVGDIW